MILIAVKPQVYMAIRNQSIGIDFSDKAILSVMAGISLQDLADGFSKAEIYRAMPNTPALIQEGSTTLCCDNPGTHQKAIEDIPGSCHLIRQSPEPMDTLTDNVCSKGGMTIAGLRIHW